MIERWLPGIWLGKRFTTDEHVVGLENGKVVRTRAVRQRPVQDMWKMEEVCKVKGQPWDPSLTLTYEKLAEEKYPKAMEPGTVGESDVNLKTTPRPHAIMKKDLRKAGGFTPGCKKCNAMKKGDPNAVHMTHSEACRTRVEAALAEDEQFQNKLKKGVKRKEQMEEEKQKQAKSSAEEVVGEGGPVKVGGDGEGGPVKVGGDGLASGAGRSAEVVQVGGSSGSTDGMPNQPLVSETRKRDREGGDQVDTDIEIPEMQDQSMSAEIRKRGRQDA